MAFNAFGEDTGVEDFSGGGTSAEERKRRLAMMASLITGQSLGDTAGQMMQDRIGKVNERVDQATNLIQNPEEELKKRVGIQPAVPQQTVQQPAQPAQPAAPQQEVQQQVPAAPVAKQPVQQPAVPQQPAVEQPTQTAQPQEVQKPINPNEQPPQMGELPTAGPGVQVAGTQPGAGVQQAATQQAPGLGLKAPTNYTQDFQSGNIYSLANKDSTAPEYVKQAAKDQILDEVKQNSIKSKVEEQVNAASTSKDPAAMVKLFDEFKRSKSEDGSYLRAYMLNRFGFKEAADAEMGKLGWGAKYVHTKIGDEDAMIKYASNGEPISGITASGKKLSASELIGAEMPSKTAMYTGGSKIFTVPKGDANEGQEYTSRFNTHTGKHENIITTGPNAGKPYTGAPGQEKRVETAAAINANKLESSKGLIDYRNAQNLKYAGPLAYTKAGAAYVGKYNAENGTNLGYNREGVLVDHNNDNKPVVQNKDGTIAAVQRVEKPAAQGAAAPAAAVATNVATQTPTTDLTKPPAYDPNMSPRENQKAQDNWAATRKKVTTDFLTGKQGQAVQSMNVAVDHLDSLQEAANALKNGNMPLFNQIGNLYSKNTGSPAVTDFNALKTIVGSEVAKAVAGGATALGDREEIRKEIDAANSPEQLAGVITKYQKLMAGQVKGLKQTYESAGLTDFDAKLLPRTKKVLNQVSEPTRSKW